jgi:hypothetical protein
MNPRLIPARVRQSAVHTADAWGVAYIGITRSAPCSPNDYAAGGHWHVTRDTRSPHYTGHPVTWLLEVHNDGSAIPIEEAR